MQYEAVASPPYKNFLNYISVHLREREKSGKKKKRQENDIKKERNVSKVPSKGFNPIVNNQLQKILSLYLTLVRVTKIHVRLRLVLIKERM